MLNFSEHSWPLPAGIVNVFATLPSPSSVPLVVLQMWTSAVMIVTWYSKRHTGGLRVCHHQLYIYNITSRAFRKFVRSYGRFFGHDILDYREQLRDAFSRPFGKEAPYANAHCSPHHFSAKRSGGAAHVSPSPYHPAIPGLTSPYGLQGWRGGPADQRANRPRVRVCQPHGGHMALALPGARPTRLARCPARGAPAYYCSCHARPGHLGGQRFATRPQAHCHEVDAG